MINKEPTRFPKIKCPYQRETDKDGRYVMTPRHNNGYMWVNDPMQSIAVEKIHGTNCAVQIQNGRVKHVWTRIGNKDMNLVHEYNGGLEHIRICRAVQNSVRKGIVSEIDGTYFGETLGKNFHSNMYDLDKDYFIPFKWARKNLKYYSWGEHGTSFKDIEEWFKDGLFSLLYQYFHGCSFKEASVTSGVFVEGVMFYREKFAATCFKPDKDVVVDATDFAKMRRDMFKGCKDWPGTILKH